MDLLDSDEAADYLGVKKPTLYAYVSRGILKSQQKSNEPRRRYYSRADLDYLKRKSDAHSGQGAAAASALRWGPAVLDTTISDITPTGPRYRGHPVQELARTQKFEVVAEMLWGEPLPRADSQSQTSGETSQWSYETARLKTGRHDLQPVARMRLELADAELNDPTRFAAARTARLTCARNIICRLAATLAEHLDAPAEGRPGELLGPSQKAANTALDAALIAVADHELNASTFAARVASSTGANLYAVVTAALATFTGPKHGGSTDRCEVLIDSVLRANSAPRAFEAWVSRGDSIPGFSHPLYPGGDPRWKVVVSRLDERADVAVIDAVDEMVETAASMELGRPNVDLALAALTRSFGCVEGSASGIFALGRSAGWIAHALEQQAQGELLRPRAHYIG